MLKFLRENLVFLISGWVLAKAYPINTYDYWIMLLALIIAFELRDYQLRQNGKLND